MRNAIKEYIELDAKEKSDLWNNATFIFDTNVLLNLYRYSNKTRNQLIKSFEGLKTRVWMPYQVALEFCKDRYSVIDEANGRFDNIETQAEKLTDSWKKELRLDSNDSDIEDLRKYLKEWIVNKRDSNYHAFSATDDEVFCRLLDLFDGKVGTPFSDDEKINIEQEGEKRYACKIPPGYKDNKKAENRYGDLFVWMEIIGYAKANDVDIIFITHDQKEDWWNTSNGKTIGPRIELRKEFYEKTGKKFHMYTMSSYLSFFTQEEGNAIDKTTIDEVELFAYVMGKKVPYAELKECYEGYESLADNNKKVAVMLRAEIATLEEKNRKRIKSIDLLSKKAKNGKLTSEGETALAGNKVNLNKDSARIEQLKKRLLYIESQE